MAHYVLLLYSFKEQLQQHVCVHAMEVVMACWEIEQSLQSLTGNYISKAMKEVLYGLKFSEGRSYLPLNHLFPAPDFWVKRLDDNIDSILQGNMVGRGAVEFCDGGPPVKYLDHNQFTGRIPDAFYKHTFLKEMYIEGNAFRPGVNPIGIHNIQHYVNGQVVIESARDTLESCSKAQTDSYQEEVAVA
ncbi:unnamed protein product [Camellia sinensis]